jgi:carbonic anhydrase
MNDALATLIDGHRAFHRDYQSERYAEYRVEAAARQTPRVMVIACSDSRVSPSIVMGAKLGEIFLVSNVANIVPPYRPDKGTHHSTSSALEFAVGTLQVEHIVVMGHSGCGGVRALLDGAPVALDGEYSFITPWVDIIAAAKQRVADKPDAERYRACECEGLKISLANLRTFPWIAERMAAGTLSIHGWHFDIPTGNIIAYDEAADRFVPLSDADA